MVRLAEGDYENGWFAVRYKNKVGLGRRERNRLTAVPFLGLPAELWLPYVEPPPRVA